LLFDKWHIILFYIDSIYSKNRQVKIVECVLVYFFAGETISTQKLTINPGRRIVFFQPFSGIADFPGIIKGQE
jgi:hypothetical protein